MKPPRIALALLVPALASSAAFAATPIPMGPPAPGECVIGGAGCGAGAGSVDATTISALNDMGVCAKPTDPSEQLSEVVVTAKKVPVPPTPAGTFSMNSASPNANRPAATAPAEDPTDLAAVGATMASNSAAPSNAGKAPLAVGPAPSGNTSAAAAVNTANTYTYQHLRDYVGRTDTALEDARKSARNVAPVNAADLDASTPDDNRSAGGTNAFGSRK
jgi:hypothetical protein